MAIATGSQHSVAYVAEAAYGTTPATPALKALRQTSCSLALTKETLQSEELRPDRQTLHLSHGTRTVGGDLGFELSYGSFDDFLEAALGGTWAANSLKQGNARRSFTIERRFHDIGEFARYTGVEMSGFSLSVEPGTLVTGSFTTIGQDMAMDTAIITGATYPVALAHAPYNNFRGNLKVDNAVSAVVTSIELSLDNGMEPLYVIGSDKTLQPSIGQAAITGSATVCFENEAMINRFLNETETAIEFTLTGDGGSYTFKLPRVKFTSGSPPEASGTGPSLLTMEFTGLHHAASATTLEITRTPTPARSGAK